MQTQQTHRNFATQMINLISDTRARYVCVSVSCDSVAVILRWRKMVCQMNPTDVMRAQLQFKGYFAF